MEVLRLLGDMARDAAPLLDLDVYKESGWEEEESLESELLLSIGGTPPRGSGCADEQADSQAALAILSLLESDTRSNPAGIERS
jgi:hypothetical protein